MTVEGSIALPSDILGILGKKEREKGNYVISLKMTQHYDVTNSYILISLINLKLLEKRKGRKGKTRDLFFNLIFFFFLFCCLFFLFVFLLYCFSNPLRQTFLQHAEAGH